MSDRTVAIERGLGGEVQTINKKRGLDLRGIVDADDYVLLMEIREMAERRGIDISSVLDRAERRMRANDYMTLRSSLQDDISKMASVLGHQEKKKTTNPFEELLKL